MSVRRPDALGAPGLSLAVGLAGGGVAVAVFPPGLNPFGPAKLLVTMTLAALACGALALDSNSRARARIVMRSPLGVAAAVLGGIAVLSLATAVDVRLALVGAYPGYTGLAAACSWIVFALAAAVSPVAENRRLVGRGMSVALCVAGAYAVLQRVGLDPMPASAAFDAGRSASVLGNAANLGAYVALALPLAGDRALAEESRLWRAVAWGGIVLGATAAGVSGSRGAWLGVVVGLCAWFALSFDADRAIGRRVARVVVVLAIVLAVTIILTPVAVERVAGGGTARSTAVGRLAVWRVTLPLITEQPVLGWGPCGFGRAQTLFATPALVDPRGRVEALDDPHNIVLSAGAATGIPGMLALLALFGTGLAAIWHDRRGLDASWAAALGGPFVGIAVAMQFHFITLDTGAAAAVLVGSIAGLHVAGVPAEAAATRRSVGWMVAAAAFVALALGAVGLVVADSSIRDGFAQAKTGEWSGASASFARARELAPWAPEFAWAEGRAATDAVASGAVEALRAGVSAFAVAESRMPGDSRVPRDLGDLLVAGAVTNQGENLWSDALSAYNRALQLAPTDPRAWLGRGVAEAGGGDLSSAVRDIGHATDLAPRFADAWDNLAAVYDALGDQAAAADARAKAAAARE